MNEGSNMFIYGTGNMAWALARGLQREGIAVAGIYGRHRENAEELCRRLDVPYCENIGEASKPGDTVILAVKDDALAALNTTLRLPGRMVVHTAGSVDLAAIDDISEYTGVFYPMERVIKFKDPDFKSVPLCIESRSPKKLAGLRALAEKLSEQVFEISSEQRKNLHLAAVFVSNFTTHILTLGGDLLNRYHLPPTILDSLVRTTFDNLTVGNAPERQTGPARRADIKIIWNHICQLEKDQPELAELYKLLSFGILKRYNLEHGDTKCQ